MLVRVHQDYAVQFWLSYCSKEMGLLKSGERRKCKRIQGMRDIPYEERLKILRLHSLEECRLREDLI